MQLEMAINEMRMNAGEEFAQLFGTIQTASLPDVEYRCVFHVELAARHTI